ncbi:MAG: hypothetical protein ACTSU5_13650, partial [Promethearchaeota archaeon]
FGTLTAAYKIGYYLGFLRNLCVELAKVVLGELSEEALEFFQRREAKEDEVPISEMEVVKPSTEQDLEAMKDVMSFLSEWGGDELAPEPIVAGGDGVEISAGNLDDLDSTFAALDQISGDTTQGGTSAAEPGSPAEAVADVAESGELPVEHLDELDSFTIPDESSDQVAEQYGDVGIPIYEGEVPPIPLADIATAMGYDQQADYGGASEAAAPVDSGQVEPEATAPPEQATPPPPVASTPGPLPPPDFDFGEASEYDDVDLDLDEADAMSEALSELGWMDEEEDGD